jgi:hypothetical protein
LRLVLTSPNHAIYTPALSLLGPVLALDPTNLHNFSAFISYPSRLSAEFIALLRRKESFENGNGSGSRGGSGGFKCSSSSSRRRGGDWREGGLSAYTNTPMPTPVTSGMAIPKPDPDPIALLILGYWFEGIGQVPHWWCGRRGRGECVAIKGWLEGKVADGDGKKELRAAVEDFGERIKGHGWVGEGMSSAV